MEQGWCFEAEMFLTALKKSLFQMRKNVHNIFKKKTENTLFHTLTATAFLQLNNTNTQWLVEVRARVERHKIPEHEMRFGKIDEQQSQ